MAAAPRYQGVEPLSSWPRHYGKINKNEHSRITSYLGALNPRKLKILSSFPGVRIGGGGREDVGKLFERVLAARISVWLRESRWGGARLSR